MATKKAVTSLSTTLAAAPNKPRKRGKNTATQPALTVPAPGDDQARSAAITGATAGPTPLSERLASPVVIRDAPAINTNDDSAVLDMYRLPNYERDGKTDRDSRIWAGQVYDTPDWLLQVAALYGSGYYVRVQRRRDGRFGGKELFVFVPPLPTQQPAKSESVDDFMDDDDSGAESDWSDDEETTAHRSHVPDVFMTPERFRLELELVRLRERNAALERHLQQPQPQPTPQPQPKSLLEQLRELKEVKALLAEDEKPQAAPALTPELLILSKALEQPDKFGAIAERVMTKILGDDEEEGWGKALKQLVPLVAETLPSFLQMFAPTTQATTPVPATTPGQPTLPHQTTPSAHGQQTTAPPATVTTAALNGDPMAAYHALLTRLLMGLEQQMPTADAAALVNSFVVMHPQFESAVLDFVRLPTPQLLATIGQIPGAAHLPTLQHAGPWLDALRDELFVDDGEAA